MTGLNDKVDIQLEVGTLATLIAGLYVMYSAISVEAIPSSVYIEIAERLTPYLKDWDYDKLSFEDFIKYNLLIIPRVMLSDEEVESYKTNSVYFERENGNVVLSITFEV